MPTRFRLAASPRLVLRVQGRALHFRQLAIETGLFPGVDRVEGFLDPTTPIAFKNLFDGHCIETAARYAQPMGYALGGGKKAIRYGYGSFHTHSITLFIPSGKSLARLVACQSLQASASRYHRQICRCSSRTPDAARAASCARPGLSCHYPWRVLCRRSWNSSG